MTDITQTFIGEAPSTYLVLGLLRKNMALRGQRGARSDWALTRGGAGLSPLRSVAKLLLSAEEATSWSQLSAAEVT